MWGFRWIFRKVLGRRSRLRFDDAVWQRMIEELGRRGEGRREAGAFLLGPRETETDAFSTIVYLDDLDPDCLREISTCTEMPTRAVGVCAIASSFGLWLTSTLTLGDGSARVRSTRTTPWSRARAISPQLRRISISPG